MTDPSMEITEELPPQPQASVQGEVSLIRRILEGALLAAGEALSLDRLENLFEESDRPGKPLLQRALAELREECEGRGFELVEVASGWRFQVCNDLAPWVNRLWEERPQKYSRAILETLALIAYRQPITRGDIEEVRGVSVSSHIIKTLAEREWIKVVGHRDVPGRPALYATTRHFLDYFGLRSLDELPTLSEIRDLDELSRSLGLDEGTDLESEQIDEAKHSGEAMEAEAALLRDGTAEQDIVTEQDIEPGEQELTAAGMFADDNGVDDLPADDSRDQEPGAAGESPDER